MRETNLSSRPQREERRTGVAYDENLTEERFCALVERGATNVRARSPSPSLPLLSLSSLCSPCTLTPSLSTFRLYLPLLPFLPSPLFSTSSAFSSSTLFPCASTFAAFLLFRLLLGSRQLHAALRPDRSCLWRLQEEIEEVRWSGRGRNASTPTLEPQPPSAKQLRSSATPECKPTLGACRRTPRKMLPRSRPP